jgi:hypothetical protein
VASNASHSSILSLSTPPCCSQVEEPELEADEEDGEDAANFSEEGEEEDLEFDEEDSDDDDFLDEIEESLAAKGGS